MPIRNRAVIMLIIKKHKNKKKKEKNKNRVCFDLLLLLVRWWQQHTNSTLRCWDQTSSNLQLPRLCVCMYVVHLNWKSPYTLFTLVTDMTQFVFPQNALSHPNSWKQSWLQSLTCSLLHTLCNWNWTELVCSTKQPMIKYVLLFARWARYTICCSSVFFLFSVSLFRFRKTGA